MQTWVKKVATRQSHLQLGARVVPDELPALVLRVRRHQRRPLPPPRGVPVFGLKVHLVVVDLSPQRAAGLQKHNTHTHTQKEEGGTESENRTVIETGKDGLEEA